MKIAIINQKGGSGKSTLSALLVKSSPGCLAVDLDPQAGLTAMVHGEPDGAGVFDAIIGDHVEPLRVDSFDIIQADERLDTVYATVKPFIIADILKRYKHKTIIMDCPPTMAGITVSAALAADVIITPADISPAGKRTTLYTVRTLHGLKKKPRVYLIGREPDDRRGFVADLTRAFVADLGAAFCGYIPKSVSVVKAASGKSRHYDFIEGMLNG